ncbi:MAG: hypothetical protein ACRDOK_18940, partial [Streptosporangiaceae bacterium]
MSMPRVDPAEFADRQNAVGSAGRDSGGAPPEPPAFGDPYALSRYPPPAPGLHPVPGPTPEPEPGPAPAAEPEASTVPADEAPDPTTAAERTVAAAPDATAALVSRSTQAPKPEPTAPVAADQQLHDPPPAREADPVAAEHVADQPWRDPPPAREADPVAAEHVADQPWRDPPPAREADPVAA